MRRERAIFAGSPTPRSLLLDELTTVEIASLIEEGFTTVLVPLGATEQHGPALPLLMDAEHGRETCLRSARALRHTLVGPTVQFGCSPQHASFTGTISVSESTLGGLIEDIAESHARSGFSLVYFWISHAENFPTLKRVLPGLRDRWPGCLVTGLHSMADYAAATWNVMGAEMGVPPEAAGSHAGEIETSMMLATRPKLVRMDLAEPGNGAPFATLAGRMMAEGMASVSANGVLGDQRSANALRGAAYLDRLARYLTGEVAAIRAGTQGSAG